MLDSGLIAALPRGPGAQPGRVPPFFVRSTMVAASTSLGLALLSKRYTRLPDWADIYARLAPHGLSAHDTHRSKCHIHDQIVFGHKNHMGLCQNQNI